jgi:hypothetical protein
MDLPSSKAQPNSLDQQVRGPYNDQRKKQCRLKNGRLGKFSLGQSILKQSREEPKLMFTSNAEHAHKHERKRLIADGTATLGGMMLTVHGIAIFIVTIRCLHTEFNLHCEDLSLLTSLNLDKYFHKS